MKFCGIVIGFLCSLKTVFHRIDTRQYLVLMAVSSLIHIAFTLVYETHSGIDGTIYMRVAEQILNSGSIIACGAFANAYWPPAFCYYLAAFWLLIGKIPTLFFILNVIIALATSLVSAQYLKRIFDKRIAYWSTFFFFNSMIIFYFTLYYKYELLTAFLLSTCFLLLFNKRSSLKKQLLIGIVLGVAALTTGRVLVLVPAFMYYTLARQREVPLSRRLLAPVVLAIGLALAIAPWSARNYLCFERFIPITTNSGVNFFMGFNENADGSYLARGDWPDEMQQIARDDNLTLYQKGLEYILNNPLGAAGLMLRKMNLLWRIHYADMVLFYPFLYVGIFVLHSAGYVRSRTTARTLQLVFLLYTVFHLFFISRYFYVIPLLPAAYAIAIHTQRHLGGWLLNRFSKPAAIP